MAPCRTGLWPCPRISEVADKPFQPAVTLAVQRVQGKGDKRVDTVSFHERADSALQMTMEQEEPEPPPQEGTGLAGAAEPVIARGFQDRSDSIRFIPFIRDDHVGEFMADLAAGLASEPSDDEVDHGPVLHAEDPSAAADHGESPFAKGTVGDLPAPYIKT